MWNRVAGMGSRSPKNKLGNNWNWGNNVLNSKNFVCKNKINVGTFKISDTCIAIVFQALTMVS